jgi:hypothetical protein
LKNARWRIVRPESAPSIGRRLTREKVLTAELTSGRALLWRVAAALRRGQLPAISDRQAHIAALDEILAGKNPKKALELGGRQAQGRDRKSASEVDRTELWPAMQVEALRARGAMLDPALERVARALKMSRETLRKAHRRQRQNALGLFNVFRSPARAKLVTQLVDAIPPEGKK